MAQVPEGGLGFQLSTQFVNKIIEPVFFVVPSQGKSLSLTLGRQLHMIFDGCDQVNVKMG